MSNRFGMEASLENGIGEKKVFVAEAYPTVRRAFVRYVYSILLAQLVLTIGIVSAVRTAFDASGSLPDQNTIGSVFWISFLASFACLIILQVRSQDYPLNLILLFVFTCCHGAMLSVGLLVIPTDTLIRCLFMTASVFVGLTIYTVQEKVDFSFMGSFLFSSLWLLICGAVLQIVFPTPDVINYLFGWFGVLVFCGYIVYDTYLLHFKLTPDQYVLAAVTLYLDLINLFLYILRVMNGRRE